MNRITNGVVVALMVSGAVNAQVHWSKSSGGNWADASNWSSGTIPSSTNAVAHDWNSGLITVDSSVAARTLVGAGSSTAKVEVVTGGNLTTADFVRLGTFGPENAMQVEVNGGTLNVGGDFSIGHWASDGIALVSSGSISVGATTKVGNDGSSSLTGTGYLGISGGTYVNNYGTFGIGVRSDGTLEMSGGTLSVDVGGNGWNPLQIGVGVGSGIVNLTGGTIETRLLEMEYNEDGDAGMAIINLLGGTLKVEGAFTVAMRVEDESEIHFDEGVFMWKGNQVGNVGDLVDNGYITWADGQNSMLTESWDVSWTNGNSVLYADYNDANSGYTTVWAAQIPEPATLGLIAMFGGGSLFLRRLVM